MAVYALGWYELPVAWREYLERECRRAPGGILVVDDAWRRAEYFSSKATFHIANQRGWLYSDLFTYEADDELIEAARNYGECLYCEGEVSNRCS